MDPPPDATCFPRQMSTPLDIMVDFATTGRLGPVRCGTTMRELEGVLGPYSDRQNVRKPRPWRPRIYRWDDLELLICHDIVTSITVRLWPDEVALPTAITGWPAPRPVILPWGQVSTALKTAGCTWRDDPGMLLDDDARAIRIDGTDVSLAFTLEDSGRLLFNISKHDARVDQGDHSPRPRRRDESA
jgi:hypothetical protein